tara:strand:+ start:186 stop:1577 length:1392 start_codon:yes stop_codon:yes gene_type:complete
MKKKVNPLWGGRFKDQNSDLLKKINNSITFDYKLAIQDISVSKAYSKVLQKAGIINASEKKKIISGLDKIEKQVRNKTFKFNDEYEDIHMNIEMALKKEVGDIAGKLHTGKSRNDQVTTDLKLWVKQKSTQVCQEINNLQKVIIKKAETHLYDVMPGFTHLQNAQPISFGHYLMAFFEMLERDKKRLKNLVQNLDECPLGSGALVGTNFFKIDRVELSKILGFKKPTNNSLDTVSDRDYVIEFLSTSAIIAIHLSRVAEDFIIWCSSGFSFVAFSDKYSTGSSIMPQKKNPDAIELIRAKSGRIFGNLFALLSSMKGLPMGYSKDLQEDKEPLFDTCENILLIVKVMTEIIKDLKVNRKNMFDSSELNFSTATDLADWLVQNLGYNFRLAHHTVGKIVLRAEKKQCKLNELDLKEYKMIDKKIDKRIFKILNSESSVANKKSLGGTGFSKIKQAINKAKKKLN